MMENERHIYMGPGYQYDYSKSSQENRIAEREYYKGRYGFDIENLDPKEKEEIEKLVKKYDKMMDLDIKRMIDEMKNGK